MNERRAAAPIDFTVEAMAPLLWPRLPKQLEIALPEGWWSRGPAGGTVGCLPGDLLWVREPYALNLARWPRAVYRAGPVDGPPPETWLPAAAMEPCWSRFTLAVLALRLAFVAGDRGAVALTATVAPVRRNIAWFSARARAGAEGEGA